MSLMERLLERKKTRTNPNHAWCLMKDPENLRIRTLVFQLIEEL